MVRRSLSTGLLIFALGSVTEAAWAQAPAAGAQPAAPTTQATPAKSTSAATPKHHKRSQKAKEEENPVEPVVQTPPAPPPTPEESPASAPQVNYQDGQLTIRSENSTLSSIFSALKARIGISVEGPGSTSSDRIATQIGPGTPRDVLDTLLENSKYDFILLGEPGNPSSVQKVVLTARSNGAPGTQSAVASAAPNRPGGAANFQRGNIPQPDPDQEMPDAEIPDDANQPEIPAQPEVQVPQPDQQQQPGQPENNGDPTQPNPNAPKSPEQLLQELQRMQQQQQQQQQQQNQNPR
jgi:hypothetical protein